MGHPSGTDGTGWRLLVGDGHFPFDLFFALVLWGVDVVKHLSNLSVTKVFARWKSNDAFEELKARKLLVPVPKEYRHAFHNPDWRECKWCWLVGWKDYILWKVFGI